MFRPAPNAVVGGKYRLDRPLAQGGMGSIWLAWQAGLERPVAVKFMARELSSSSIARARFDREARAAAQLRTPHVVQMHDHGIEDDTPYIVMELLEGEDLNARLRRARRLPLPEIARIALQMAKALRRAQEANIVHRDLKPANVFLARADDEEVVKVLDFGIARLAEEAGGPGSGESTRSGAVVGSPHYMSPEQARGMEPIDHRSDLWAFGVILFRLTTGAVPFPGSELGDIIIRVWNDPPPAATALVPDLPPALDGFFTRALAKNREDRFQSATEMAHAFAAAAGVAVAHATGPHTPHAASAHGTHTGHPAAAAGASPTHPGSGSHPAAPAMPAPSFHTPVSWPGATAAVSYPGTPASISPNAIPAAHGSLTPRTDGTGGTLGGSHGLDARPAASVPVAAWMIGALGILGLGAAALIMALRSPVPAAGDRAPTPVAAAGNTGAAARAGTTATSGADAPAAAGSATSGSLPPADPGSTRAPATAAPSGADPAGAAPTATGSAGPASAGSSGPAAAGKATSPAGTSRPKGGGRRGHDFGY